MDENFYRIEHLSINGEMSGAGFQIVLSDDAALAALNTKFPNNGDKNSKNKLLSINQEPKNKLLRVFCREMTQL